MIAIVFPSQIRNYIKAPRSKSDMQRACAAALLHKGSTTIKDPGRSNDDKAALDVISKLGAAIHDLDDTIEIFSKGVDPTYDEIHCGESGLGIRMFTPIAALSSKKLLISGMGSLINRPMHFFDEIFPQLRIAIETNKGRLPLQIQGPLTPSDIEIDGSLSSQFLTGMLMAYSASDPQDVTIAVRDLKSKPYIDMTLQVMAAFGMKLPVVENYESFYFDKSPFIQNNQHLIYTIEGDWSGAAFLLVSGAIANEISITGMREDSVQADKKILEAITKAGAILKHAHGTYTVSPSNLNAFEFDATECPDLFPPLVALAAYCKGITRIKGANRLTHKESNRALSLQDVFGKMGVTIVLEGDEMLIHGGALLRSAHLHSHHDHRIAMAAAVAALRADGPVTIENAEAINKSYPDFYSDLQTLGTKMVLEP